MLNGLYPQTVCVTVTKEKTLRDLFIYLDPH